MQKVVFIIGFNHGGSTLLDLILGSHSKAFSLGELCNLHRRLDSQICGVCAGHCEFWDERVPLPMLRSYTAGSQSTNPLRVFWYKKFGSIRLNIYEELMKVSGKRIMLDSSKSPAWVKRQLRPWWHWTRMTPYFIFITRDGRGVTNSLLQKYPKMGMEHWARSFVKNAHYLERQFVRLPKDRRLRVAYERLTALPEETVRSICELIDETFEPSMLRYWEHEHHATAGNIGPRRLIFEYRKRFGSNQSEFWTKHMGDQPYYREMGLAIKTDLRWMKELTQQDLRAFEAIGAQVNRRYKHDE